VKQTYETKNVKTTDYSIQLFLDYYNERLRVDYYRGNMTMILDELERVACQRKFSKLIFYSRPEHWQLLLSTGFELEAMIKSYFNGTDMYMMTRYKEIERRTSDSWIEEDVTLHTIMEKERKSEELLLPDGYQLRKATVQDADQLANLYRKVFAVYPTPMNEAEYVKK
jgi:beta-lysine N6-acetyltransferase